MPSEADANIRVLSYTVQCDVHDDPVVIGKFSTEEVALYALQAHNDAFHGGMRATAAEEDK